MNPLEGIERIHLMGIGGAGMSALALLFSEMRCTVSGCDLARSDYMEGLESQGIECATGHAREHITRFSPQLVVHSSAVDVRHTELVAARENGIRTAGRGEALSWLFNARTGIGVAGTHGKTTTSSMIALILERAGRAPTLAIGAEVRDFGTNARVGQSDLFVAEIDESDGSFEFFTPSVTVITNIDWDHVDHFPRRQDVQDAFARFASGRKPGTPLVICAEDQGSQTLIGALRETDPEVLTCGWGRSWNWGAFDVRRKPGGGVVFSVSRAGDVIGDLELGVSGEHNIMNALVACAAAVGLGVPFASVAESLRAFRGAERRLQRIGAKAAVEVVDDYGHHPTEIAASLSALRDIYPGRRLVVVHQPHRYTRTRAFRREIAAALEGADIVLLLPVYAAGELPLEEASSEAVARAMEANGSRCLLCGDEKDALRALESLLREGDVLVTLGAGSVSHLGRAYLGQVR